MGAGDLVSVQVTGGAPVLLQVAGDLDVVTVPEFEAVLVAVANDDVVVDMAGVTFLGSTGVNALIRAMKRARETGRSFAVRSPSPSVVQVLTITGVDTVLTVEPVD